MIGIITYYDGTNYGTTLQALALQKAISDLGYDNEIIDFIPYLENKKIDIIKYRISHPREMTQKLYAIIVGKRYKEKRVLRSEKFNDFIKDNICLSKETYHYNRDFINNPPQYDGFIVGSDQTWNPYVAGNPDCLYLSFVKDSAWKGTYAPSISLADLNDIQKEHLQKMTKDIDFLSCREESGTNIIKECTGKKAYTVLDPTMLINANEWEKYIKKVEKPENYILEYFLGDNKEYRKEIKKISERLKMKIVSLPYSYIDSSRTDGYYAGPGEFLDLIKNASLVCTDSFHGTVFSIIFRRPMLTFNKYANNDKKSENSRIHDLLRSFGISDRMFISDKSIKYERLLSLDKKIINENMDRLQEKSYKYLRNMLQNKGKSNTRDNISSVDIKNNCYSCFACEYVCPTKAITLDEDKGFFRPFIDENKCIYCGKCKEKCLIENDIAVKPFIGKAYISFLREELERKKSSSGGVFKALADSYIENGGYVVGCIYDDNLQPKHVVTNERNVVDKMVGSKYVQSNLIGVYESISKLLEQGKHVLFSGLPCQVRTVYNLFSKYETLTLVALVCHGVMPRDIWRKYIIEEEYRKGNRVKTCNMRDKRKGWTDYGLCFTFEDGTEEIVYRKTNGHLLKCYTDGLWENDRCLSCKIKGDHIVADIIIGDGWSGNNISPGIDDGKGISEVFLMSKKGDKCFSEIKEKMITKECNFNLLYEDSPRLWSPEVRHPDLEKFRKYVYKPNFNLHEDLKKFARPNILMRATMKLKKYYNSRKN